jgi:hypothetical protein
MLNTPIVKDICQFLSDYSSLTLKIDLYAGELKRGVNGVFAIAAPSEAPDKETGIIYQSIEFWARNDDTEKAFTHLTEIYNFFDRRHHYSTNHYFIHFSHCESQIEDMDKDSEGAKLLKLSVRFILNSTTAIS